MERKYTDPVTLANGLHYLNKQYCITEAKRMLAEGILVDMSEQEIAEELFAHAWLLHTFAKLPFRPKLIGRIIAHADPIDLQNGGDKAHRMLAFRLIWKLSRGTQK